MKVKCFHDTATALIEFSVYAVLFYEQVGGPEPQSLLHGKASSSVQ